ncbi:M14 family zinc carboxypeptidase [Sphingobacterium spiritivorum]|uniref:Peptidase M14 domain-containing protein n=2 Tax=Sphingobacterium spiritivorum TaxID=258 RepID=D7VP22_SPHSI|nr:M14 family zinc carboxypeptidase [Sphingobacterium spiritivorum]EFK57669.1 hypothetical protein HMPREF0766_12742 [Sphingobacterium spiritivorum ATCC 33861]QQT36288.1 peptidase M14 [Sphingobacterium spiritivorum]
MNKLLIICLLMLIGKDSFSQSLVLSKTQLDKAHMAYKESALKHRRFKHADVEQLILRHQQQHALDVQQIGSSVEQRSIYELRYGTGKKVVMLWSQMHGDEPTATMALFDLFNFLEGKEDDFEGVRTLLQEHLSIHFIPMLNPDGAERYTRRNAQKIDLNRDARNTATPEGKLLRARAESLKPQYGFNLHDQNIYYNVPGTQTPVTISLLAPAYNMERDINEVRGNAMKIIVGMEKLLQNYIPGAVAKYDDEHSPRAFGDNFQKWGASTVLIESGAFKGDPEKQEIRKLNFAIILNALVQIAQGSYQQYDIKDYERIPFNASQLHDVVLRNVSTVSGGLPLQVDIAIRRDEITSGNDYYSKGYIEDLGDLKEFYGYDDLDATGLTLSYGQIYPTAFRHYSELTADVIFGLLKQGYSTVIVREQDQQKALRLPVRIVQQPTEQRHVTGLSPGQEATFFLKKDNELKYAIVNGYLIDLSRNLPDAFNGIK